MLKERQKSILEAAIVEHIRTARPVASQEIMQRLCFGISPATIRNEMQSLDEGGYLEQPHTSAGRIPTDKGYRFFVDNLIEHSNLNTKEEKYMERAFRGNEQDECIKNLSKTIAEISGTFTVAGVFDNDIFYDNGLTDVLDEPEFEEADSIRSFGRLVDMLNEAIPELFKKHEIEQEAIFIGEENPLKEARGCTMTVSRWRHPRGFEGFLAMVGPKRAQYQKQVAILHYLEDIRN